MFCMILSGTKVLIRPIDSKLTRCFLTKMKVEYSFYPKTNV